MTETIAAILQRRAGEHGDSLAFAFVSDGAAALERITYAELDAQAEVTAAAICRVAAPGDRVLLVHEAGLEFVGALMGCLYAGVVAVPLPAPEASRMKGSNARLDAVVRDSGARLLIGTERARGLVGEVAGVQVLRSLSSRAKSRDLHSPQLDDLAYLQYTSGSTSSPKGVMITHRNIVGHLAGMQAALGYDDASVSVCWMPHFHDYGLVEGILLPLFNGTPSYLMPPFAFLKRPASWLDAITRYRGTHTQAFNFAYRYCTRRVTPGQRGAIELSSLRSAGNGGEPIHPDTSEEFYNAFSSCGLRAESLAPVFGLAEATLLVSAVPVTSVPVVAPFDVRALGSGRVLAQPDPASARRIASCGPLLPETTVAIVNPETRQRAADDEVGEIWVNAPGVAAGYWQRDQESEETFRAKIVGDGNAHGYMRTGDLGFIHRGELFISAREKDLIIVHGLNHYPQDIEWTVQQAHPLLRADNGAAFSVDVDGEERLCIIQEIDRGAHDAAEVEGMLAAVVSAVVEQHGVPPYRLVLIKRASIPKTTSGKIKRRTCRERFLAGTLDIVTTWPPASMSTAMDDTTDTTASSARTADELIAWLRDYGERRINSRLIDERRTLPPNIVLDFGNRGLFGLQVPEQYGGLALRTVDTLRVYMQLAAIDPTIATLVFLHNTNGIRPILHHASPELRDELLPILARGRELAAFTLSEPGAGSSLGSISTSATADGDGWRIDGEKRWNGSAWCGVISVFARLLDADGRARGLCGFVVRQSDPGVVIGPESLTMGVRGIVQNSVRLDCVHVSRDRLLGELGGGMRVVDDVLSHGRLATAAVALGIALRSAQLILRYTSRREIETGLLLENPQTMSRISELVHRVDIGRALLLHCAERLDAGDEIIPAVAMAIKVGATETGNDAADLLVQLLGGRGYMENNIAPQLFRDARMLRVGEGANEGLVAAVGRGVRLADALRPFLATLEASGTVHTRLMAASSALEATTIGRDISEGGAQAWRDALRGGLAIAALELAMAQTMGSAEGKVYAGTRFDRLFREVEQGGADLPAMLVPDQIRERINSYREVIGDVEPLAPDVDYALDPLLQRDRRAAEVQRGSDESLEQKRERLRRLLVERRHGA